MAVNLVSPGVNVREVDLTLGGIIGGSQNIGAIVGPFEKGPVNTPTLIENEQQLLQIFGKPKKEDDQYEYWMSASNYLSYGGILQVIRAGVTSITSLNNSYSPISGGSTELNLKIDNFEDYQNNHTADTDWAFSAKNPGSWANNLKVCVIDSAADQIISGINTTQVTSSVFDPIITNRSGTLVGSGNTIGINTSGITLGLEVVCDTPGFISTGTTVIGISTDDVITLSTNSLQSSTLIGEFDFGNTTVTTITSPLLVGQSVVQEKNNVVYSTGIGATASFTGELRGIITGIGNSSIDVKITDIIASNGTSTSLSYKIGDALSSFDTTSIDVLNSSGNTVSSINNQIVLDWYDSQTLNLSSSTLFWKNIAPKPGTSQYAASRNSKNDEIHVVIVDDFGTISGTSPTVLEKHLNLSKAVDGKISPSQPIYYKDYINQNSNYIFVGIAETASASSDLVSTGAATFTLKTGAWGSTSNNTTFNVIGRKTYTFGNGTDYSSGPNSYEISNSEIINSYNLFKNTADYNINYIIGGPSGGPSIYDAQAKANALIAIAEERKDCVATISPYKASVINVSNSNTQTENIIKFFEPLTSSSYAIFDSGYKYTLDRFNNRFVYIPCSSDIAGIMARTADVNYPWLSPAGTNRGALLNTIKLAYSPNQGQRDELYTKRINPIIASPGAGFVLFGDKTALSYASAFDRINVRMLFLTIEKSIEQAARAQLFEFNDAITRTNFINIVEPYLRDVRAKRGITEFLVVCDETNNTPDVIDANQFKADIFVKPARSINFIGLTFVATRTGISFSEVVGTV